MDDNQGVGPAEAAEVSQIDGYEVMDFDLDNLAIREEKSMYPFEKIEVGKGFLVRKKSGNISGRVSAYNKKSDKEFVTRVDPKSTKDNPMTWVIRKK